MNKDEIAVHVEEDLTEIVGLIAEYIDKKYITQIKNELNGFRKECENDICNEGQLIKAMIPFVSDKAPILQSVVDLIVYNDMIEKTFETHNDLSKLYRDDNEDRQEIKKLMYKLVLFKFIKMIENK